MKIWTVLKQLPAFVFQSAMYGGAAWHVPHVSTGNKSELIIRGLSKYVENGRTYIEEDPEKPEFFGVYLRSSSETKWLKDFSTYSEALAGARSMSLKLNVSVSALLN